MYRTFGYFIKNNSSKEEYEEEIAKLENDYNQNLLLYDDALQKEEEIQDKAQKNLSLQQSKQDHIKELRKNEEDLIQKISALKNEKKSFKNNGPQSFG